MALHFGRNAESQLDLGQKDGHGWICTVREWTSRELMLIGDEENSVTKVE